MYEQEQTALNALRSVYDALEAVRQELREAQKQTGDHGTRIAVLDVKLASIEKKIKELADDYGETKKRPQQWLDWGTRLIGGAAILYVLSDFLG